MKTSKSTKNMIRDSKQDGPSQRQEAEEEAEEMRQHILHPHHQVKESQESVHSTKSLEWAQIKWRMVCWLQAYAWIPVSRYNTYVQMISRRIRVLWWRSKKHRFPSIRLQKSTRRKRGAFLCRLRKRPFRNTVSGLSLKNPPHNTCSVLAAVGLLKTIQSLHRKAEPLCVLRI